MAVGGASLRKCIAVYFPRWLLSSFNECSHFQTLQHGPFQSFEEECYFSGHSPVNLVRGHSHYVIASEIAALTAEDFRPKLSGFRAARIELLSAKRACCLLVFYPIHSHTRFPHPPEKTLGPIAAFAGKLSSFDVAAKHEAEIYPDTGCGSRRLCAVRICLP